MIRRLWRWLTGQQTVVAYLPSSVTLGLYVARRRGRYTLEAPTANYSHGELYDVFAELWQDGGIASRTIRKALLLGFGGGSVWQLLHNSHPQATMVGVELDAVVLAAGQNYWPAVLASGQLQLVQQEASHYLAETDAQFDLVVVDVFVDRDIPPSMQTEGASEAVWQHVAPGGLLLWNVVTDTPQRLAWSRQLHAWLHTQSPTARIWDRHLNHVHLVQKPAD